MTKSVDQRRRAIERFFAVYGGQLARQGAIVQTSRRRGGRTLGPYYLLSVRDAAGRQVSVYLGPPSPLVDEVRERLESCRRGRCDRRNIDAARRSLRRAIANVNQVLDRELAVYGLYRRGFQIRGWSRPRVCRSPTDDLGGARAP